MTIQVHLTLPDGVPPPEGLSQCSPEETLLILQVGLQVLVQAKTSLAALDHEEWKARHDQHWQAQLQELQERMASDKRVSESTEVGLRRFYEAQVEQWQRKWEAATQEMCRHQQDVQTLVEAEARRVTDRLCAERDALLKEKDKQVDRLTQAYEHLLVQQSTTKSNAVKGNEGEQQFADYARTFMDFKGFQLRDKHTQGGEGDFHLHFEEFDVLVDAKNYRKKVPFEQRDKIRKDLAKHEHIPFAWLVSLNTQIETYDRAPVMYEWINPRQCIVYINHLRQFDDPTLLLRIVWFTCRELVKLTDHAGSGGDSDDAAHETNWKDKHFQTMDKIKTLRKSIREVNTSINHTKHLVQTMDDQLRHMMDEETSTLVDSHVGVFDAWWSSAIVVDPEAPPLLSTDAWFHFRDQHRSLLKTMDITIDHFRSFVKAKVPVSHILPKSKHSHSAFHIRGIRLKSLDDTPHVAAASPSLDSVDLVPLAKKTRH